MNSLGIKQFIMLRSVLCIVLAAFSCNMACAQSDEDDSFNPTTIRASDLPAHPPQFKDFPATEAFNGKRVEPDVMHDPDTRQFRTMIRRGAATGPNFAGHYTIVTWGCGNACLSVAIVDANTGKVYNPKELGWVDFNNIDDEVLAKPEDSLIKYRKDSRLLIVIGGINEDSKLRGISYFTWDKGALHRIRFVHKPYE